MALPLSVRAPWNRLDKRETSWWLVNKDAVEHEKKEEKEAGREQPDRIAEEELGAGR